MPNLHQVVEGRSVYITHMLKQRRHLDAEAVRTLDSTATSAFGISGL